MSISTSDNGIDASGNVSVFTVPGGVTVIDRGTVMVEYGPVQTASEFDLIPVPVNNVIIEVLTGGETQAPNLVLIRTVTITPAT